MKSLTSNMQFQLHFLLNDAQCFMPAIYEENRNKGRILRGTDSDLLKEGYRKQIKDLLARTLLNFNYKLKESQIGWSRFSDLHSCYFKATTWPNG